MAYDQLTSDVIKENAELKELLGKSLESLKNDCKTFADCRPRPYSMSQAEQEALIEYLKHF